MIARAACTDAALAEIYAHARDALPAECCGYVLAGGTVVRCANAVSTAAGAHVVPTGSRGPETAFSIEGEELLAFVRSLDSRDPARVVYHSHTHGRAYLSELDRAVAATADGPVYPVGHLVVGVTAQGVSEAALYEWDASARDFVETFRRAS